MIERFINIDIRTWEVKKGFATGSFTYSIDLKKLNRTHRKGYY